MHEPLDERLGLNKRGIPADDLTRQRKFMDELAEKVVRWRMAVPAIFILESSRPVSFVGSQVMVFFRPFVESLFAFKSYDSFAEILDDRRNLDYLLEKIEHLESLRLQQEKRNKKTRSFGLLFWRKTERK